MNTKGDVWVSTVLYTLIGLAIMGSMLAILQPKISEMRDKFVFEQTVQSMSALDDTITNVREATGMRLNYIIRLDKGNLVIDGANEKISWQAQSRYQFSEQDKQINITGGKIQAFTISSGGLWDTTLTMNYAASKIDIKINGANEARTLTPATNPYSIWITNKGISGGLQVIDISIE